MRAPRFIIESEFSFDEFLLIQWAVEWAFEHGPEANRPQMQTVRKLKREERRMSREYLEYCDMRAKARAEAAKERRRLARIYGREQLALYREAVKLQRQRDQVADGESGQAALAGDFQAFYEARERELNGLELNGLSDQVEK